jgi:hypothetical protein
MSAPISSGLKTTFLVHAIFGIVFGLSYLFVPTTVGGLFGLDASDPAWRVLGVTLIAFGVSSWLGYRASDWSQVAIIVETEIVLTILSTLTMLWLVLTNGLPALVGWLDVVIFAAFAAAFIYFFATRKK